MIHYQTYIHSKGVGFMTPNPSLDLIQIKVIENGIQLETQMPVCFSALVKAVQILRAENPTTSVRTVKFEHQSTIFTIDFLVFPILGAQETCSLEELEQFRSRFETIYRESFVEVAFDNSRDLVLFFQDFIHGCKIPSELPLGYKIQKITSSIRRIK